MIMMIREYTTLRNYPARSFYAIILQETSLRVAELKYLQPDVESLNSLHGLLGLL